MHKSISRRSVFLIALIYILVTALTVQAQIAAGKAKWLGNIIASSVPSNFATYWNQVTPENAGKWGSAESSRDSYNWGQLDTAYNYAISKGYPFKLHTLVWGSQEPPWIGSLAAADQKAEVEEWIKDVLQRYPNAAFVDVVNEPLHAPASYRNALGGSGTTGWDWVIWSFETARKYTSAKLLINDYNITLDATATSNYLTIINLLKSRGLIDGIGDQCHSYETVSVSTIQTNMNTLNGAGLPIYVSEYEIRGDDATQLSLYQQQFPFFWTFSGIKGITLWGYIQGQIWRTEAYLVTSGGAERPALQWIKTYVASATTGPTPTMTTTRTATVTVTANNKGDVNSDGSISIVDALMIAQYTVGLNPSNFTSSRADVNCDGSITIVDALIVAQYTVGLVSSFC